MEPLYRKEINAFILNCETLLSPLMSKGPFTKEERQIMLFYARLLASRFQED